MVPLLLPPPSSIVNVVGFSKDELHVHIMMEVVGSGELLTLCRAGQITHEQAKQYTS